MAKKTKNEQKNSIFDKIKLGEIEEPACVQSQCRRFYVLAVLLALVGIVFAFFLKEIILFPMALVGTVALFLIGYMREYEITHNGYVMVKGRCERIEYTLTSRMTGPIGPDVPSRYIIRNELFDRELYGLPYFKQNPTVEEDDIVAIYFKKNVKFFKSKGVNMADHILGYETLPREY